MISSSMEIGPSGLPRVRRAGDGAAGRPPPRAAVEGAGPGAHPHRPRAGTAHAAELNPCVDPAPRPLAPPRHELRVRSPSRAPGSSKARKDAFPRSIRRSGRARALARADRRRRSTSLADPESRGGGRLLSVPACVVARRV